MEFEKNEDGTDKLDENGKPIPVKVIDEKEKEAAKVNAQLVEEIKQLRLEKSIAEGLLKEKSEKKPEVDPNKVLTDDEKLEALLDKKLKEKAALDAQANKKAAFERFVAENKEFSPDNDPTGLKRDALQKKLNQFNTGELSTVGEFLSVIGEAKILLLGNDNQADTTREINLYSNPPKTPNIPPNKKNEELTSKELKLIQQSGVTKEKIMKLKANNPEYLAGLLEYVHD